MTTDKKGSPPMHKKMLLGTQTRHTKYQQEGMFNKMQIIGNQKDSTMAILICLLGENISPKYYCELA
jgi:hypothetical protein